MIAGWSQHHTPDDSDCIHLEAETLSPARSVVVDFDGNPIIEVLTCTSFTSLPGTLKDRDGRPLPWLRALLGERQKGDQGGQPILPQEPE